MEIKLIGPALDEIKEEDQNILSELETRVEEISKNCALMDQNTARLKKEYESYEALDDIFNNPIKHIHMILPALEVPIGIVMMVLSMTSMIINPLSIIGAAIALTLEADAFHTILEKYPEIMETREKGFKSYINAFKKLFLSQHDVKVGVVRTCCELADAKNDSVICNRELSDAKGEADKIRRELLLVEGYIRSIEYVQERQYFETLGESLDIVKFINKKKELKKDC